jgi:Ca-activated chloride channel homolog
MWKKFFAILVVLFIACPLVSQIPKDPKAGVTIRSEVSLVDILFSATDKKGRIIKGLKAEDFQIFDNGRPQKIEYFSSPEKWGNVPLRIALAIDTSESVSDKLEFELSTAAEFFKQILRPNRDSALIIQFDSDVNLVQGLTRNVNDLLQALNSIRAGSNTALYDAIYLAAEELKAETGRKVIVVISDGADNISSIHMDEAIESAQKRDALIYGIGVLCDQCGHSDLEALKKLAKETGGRFFSPKDKLSAIKQAFSAIQQDIQGQYGIAYYPGNIVRDGSFRSLELKCRIPGVRISVRKGYYSPKAVPAN